MDKAKILVTRLIPEAPLRRLEEVFEVSLHRSSSPMPRAELLNAVRDADALLCMLTEAVDAELIDAAPRLQVISNFAVGYNNIDVNYATQKGIAVCNTPGVLTETTADLAWALLMACARRIVESDSYVRQGRFSHWDPLLLLGHDVWGKTLGLVGLGRIGRAVAKRASGFDMRILYYDPAADPAQVSASCQAVELSTLCRESDFISLHAPLTPQTRHLIGAPELALMKPGAFLINTARGPIVDEAALIKALQEKRLAGAGLDVYEAEPLVPPELLAMDNVVLLPHIGSASITTRDKMGLLAAENAIAIIEGRVPPARVN